MASRASIKHNPWKSNNYMPQNEYSFFPKANSHTIIPSKLPTAPCSNCYPSHTTYNCKPADAIHPDPDPFLSLKPSRPSIYPNHPCYLPSVPLSHYSFDRPAKPMATSHAPSPMPNPVSSRDGNGSDLDRMSRPPNPIQLIIRFENPIQIQLHWIGC